MQSKMTGKWPLYAGMLILVTGVLLKILSPLGFSATLIIMLGAAFKIFYIIQKIKNKEYKPGIEMLILYTGVALFFTGVYLKSKGSSFNPYFLMGPGIAMKLTFIIAFILKTKERKVIEN